MISTATRLLGIHEYYFSQKLREIAGLRAQGHHVLNLGIGSPDLPPSERSISALCEAAQQPQNHAYQSYQGILALREAMSAWYATKFGVNLDASNQILPLIGSKEGIMHLSMTFLESGDVALVPNPGYPSYSVCAKLAGATVRHYDLNAARGWLPDLEELASSDLSSVKIMWVNYPNMPTGANADRGFFDDLIAFGQAHNILIINDNPYAFVLPKGRPLSIMSSVGAFATAVELNSLSKSHNMAGWRIGMLVGDAHYIGEVIRFKSNMDSGMFQPIQVAAVEALRADETWYAALNETYSARQKLAIELLNLLGCKPKLPQTGLFVWAKIPENYADAYTLSDQILEQAKVFITPGGIFGSNGNNYVRISLCATKEVFQAAISRIESSIVSPQKNTKI